MKVTLKRTKMATHTPSFAYDAYVAIDCAPDHAKSCRHQIVMDSRSFYSLADALVPANHYDMPRGFARYDDYLKIEKTADELREKLCRRAFPELEGLPFPRLLWIEIPDSDLSSAQLTVEFFPELGG